MYARTIMLTPAVVVLAVAMSARAWPAAAPSGAAGGYHLVRSTPLGAPNAWDYLTYDPPTQRVFIAHGNRLTVVDARTGQVAGEVAPIPGGPHGIAIVHAAGVGVTDDGRNGQAVIFNLKTLAVIKRLAIQPGADAVTYDPVSGHVFVIDGDTGGIAVIDPVRESVITTIQVGGDLEYAVPGDNGRLYVNGVTHRQIFRIDTASNRIDAAWPVAECQSPHGLAIDTATHRLFTSCENQRLLVVNSDNGTVVATLPIGRGTDAAHFDAKRRLIFSSNGRDGTLSVIREIDADRFVPLTTVKTALSGRTMALAPASGRVFVVAARTTPEALRAFFAAWRHSGNRPASPFTPDSLRLLSFDPAQP